MGEMVFGYMDGNLYLFVIQLLCLLLLVALAGIL